MLDVFYLRFEITSVSYLDVIFTRYRLGSNDIVSCLCDLL